jgi:deoxyribose-phosphate aldolase
MRLARYIEHTLLRADATPEEVERHCLEAVEHGLFAVCVSPLYVTLARRRVGDAASVVTVAGFPLGTSTSAAKADEARRAVAEGASEVDMVMAIGLARSADWAAVRADVLAVRQAAPDAVLKVILETGYFDEAGIRRAAEAAVEAGADFVKTSTGFGPRGATVEDIRLLGEVVGGRAQVKASGGIRTAAQARAMIGAGATRIGTSNGVEIAASSE